MIAGWAAAVVTHLGSTLTGVDVEHGEMDGVQRDRDVVAVWAPGWDEISRDTTLAQPTLALRYFPSRSKQPSESVPPDPSPLEDAMDTLLAAFDRASQAPGFFVAGLSCRLTQLRPSYDPSLWRVDGTLLAYTLGAGA